MWNTNCEPRYSFVFICPVVGALCCARWTHPRLRGWSSACSRAECIATVLEEYGITKTRFPSEDMDEVGWMNDNPRKPFRQSIHRNVLLSPSITTRRCSPVRFTTVTMSLVVLESVLRLAAARSPCSVSSTVVCVTRLEREASSHWN